MQSKIMWLKRIYMTNWFKKLMQLIQTNKISKNRLPDAVKFIETREFNS